MKKLFGLGILLVVLVAACSPAGNISKRNPGTLRDFIFSVEPRNNGSYIIWMRNDNIAAYCTTDKAIGDTALQAIHSRTGEVIMEYRNRETLDKESRDANQGGCVVESTGAKNDTPIFKILSIEIVSNQ